MKHRSALHPNHAKYAFVFLHETQVCATSKPRQVCLCLPPRNTGLCYTQTAPSVPLSSSMKHRSALHPNHAKCAFVFLHETQVCATPKPRQVCLCLPPRNTGLCYTQTAPSLPLSSCMKHRSMLHPNHAKSAFVFLHETQVCTTPKPRQVCLCLPPRNTGLCYTQTTPSLPLSSFSPWAKHTRGLVDHQKIKGGLPVR